MWLTSTVPVLYVWGMPFDDLPSSGKPASVLSRKPAKRSSNPTKGTYTFDPEKVKALAAQGLNCKDIGAVVGVDQSTIWRFLDRAKVEAGHVKRYTENRADVLARMGGRVAGLIEGVSDALLADIENGMLASCKTEVKAGILRDLSVVKGVIFDKERLERGQSTQNVSLIGKMMGEAFGSVHKEAKPAPIEGGKLGS